MQTSRQRKVSGALGRSATIVAVALFAVGIATGKCLAQDAQYQAQELSDHAFTMLNAINASSSKAGPILAPAASLAGDAQALSTALNNHDTAASGSAMAAVLSDRDRIEAAAKIAGGQYPDEWATIREKIASLQKEIPASRAATASSEGAASAPVSYASVAPPVTEKMPTPPKIQIASRVFLGGAVRIKGFLEGTDLKSAGIYDGDSKSKDIEVASVPGEQRLNFDFSIDQPSPSQSIRVTDSYGREAQALIAPDRAGVGAMKGSEELIEVEPGATSGTSDAPMVESSTESTSHPGSNNTAEIPSGNDSLSPSRRHIDANSSLGPMTNVQINVIDAEELMSAPGNVEVVGQIAGPGVRHAGVYVNDRLVKQIAVSSTGYSAFDVTFPMAAGANATIRAYGNGNNFVEASIDTVGGGAGITEYRNPPMYPYGTYSGPPYYPPNPYAYANPYARGYNPYAPNPYPYGYGYPPNGAAPPPNVPWYQRLFH